MASIENASTLAFGGASFGGSQPPHTYFGVARAIIPGVRRLVDTPADSPISIALLASHALECLLKAFLSRGGSDDRLRKQNLRHDLVALWQLAAEEGLPIVSEPPYWVSKLGALHREPYYLRYAKGINGVVLPPLGAMLADLSDLESIVWEVVQNPGWTPNKFAGARP